LSANKKPNYYKDTHTYTQIKHTQHFLKIRT
jgi:hypothetical protein